MNLEVEQIIIKNFFVKRIQDRIQFELSSQKKRKDALSRLCHNYQRVINETFMFEVPNHYSNFIEIASLLRKNGAGEFCYIMSWNEETDGKEMPLNIALQNEFGSGMPTIISCIPNKLLYFEGEQENGQPPRFILKKDELIY